MNVRKGMTVTNLITRMKEALVSRETIPWDVACGGLDSAPRVLILSDRMDATYYATFHFPLQYLQRKGLADFAVISSARVRRALSGEMRAQELVDKLIADVSPRAVVFSRYAAPSGGELLRAVQSHGITAVYYCDDDLSNVPPDLGAGVLRAHATSEVVEERRACLGTADWILASTPYLAHALREQFPTQQTEVLRYPPYLASLLQSVPCQEDADKCQSMTIGYMGSKGHQRDLDIAVPALVGLMERIPNLRFETFGTVVMPDALSRFGRRVTAHAPRTSYEEFLQMLGGLHWDVGLAPLRDNPFNRCRSPIKYLEYTAAHIPTVASDVEIYRQAMDGGCGLLVRDQDWEAALGRVVLDGALRRSCLGRARESCAIRFAVHDVAMSLLAALHIHASHGSVQ